MSDCSVNIVIGWITTMDHQTINKLHGLGSLTPEFAGHNNFTALGATFHDKAENTIASSSDCQTSNQFVSERFALSNGTETTCSHLLCIELYCALWKVESLLHHRCQLTNASALLSQHILCASGQDDDFSTCRCY